MIYICLLEEALCQPPGHRLSWLPVTGSVQEGARWHLNVDEGLGLSDVLRSSKLESESRSVVSDSLRPHGLYRPWDSPGQNTGVGSLSLLQGVCPTQGSNPGLQHCRQNLYQLSHKGNPRILERAAFPFSRGSAQPRDQTQVSCIAGRIFTS